MAQDPIQGLIDYVNEIKPFHTKILEVAVAYAQNDDIDVTFTEDLELDISIFWPAIVGSPDEGPIRVCAAGYGVLYDRPTPYIVVDAGASPQTLSLQGDHTNAFSTGDRIEVREPYSIDFFIGSPNIASPQISTFQGIVAVNADDTGSASRIITSPDGFNWTERTTPVADTVAHTGITFSDTLSRFVICTNTRTVLTSDNGGISWDEQANAIPDAGNNNEWNAVTWISELELFFIANVDNLGPKIAYSADGISWTSIPQAQTPLIGALDTFGIKFQYITSISKVVLYAGANSNFHMAYSDTGTSGWKDVLCHTGNFSAKAGSHIPSTEWSSGLDLIVSIESSNGTGNGPVFKSYDVGAAGSPLFAAADWANDGFAPQSPPFSYRGHYTDLKWIEAGSPAQFIVTGQGASATSGGLPVGSPARTANNFIRSYDYPNWERIGGVPPIRDGSLEQPFIWNQVDYVPALDRLLMLASSVDQVGGFGSPETYFMRISDPVVGNSRNYHAGPSKWTKVDVPGLTGVLEFGAFAGGDGFSTSLLNTSPEFYKYLTLSVNYDAVANTTVVGIQEINHGYLGSPVTLGSPSGGSPFAEGSPPLTGNEFWFPPYSGDISGGDVFVCYDVVATDTLRIITRPIEFYGSPIVLGASPYTPIWPNSAGSPFPGSPKVWDGSPTILYGSPWAPINYGSPEPAAGNTITVKSTTPGIFLYGQEVEIRNASEPQINRAYNIFNAEDLGGSPNLVRLTVLDSVLADTTNDGELIFTPDGFSGGDICGDVPPEILQTVWLEDLDMTWRFEESPLEENFQLFIIEADDALNTYTVQGDVRTLLTVGSPSTFGTGSPATINITVQHGVTTFGSPFFRFEQRSVGSPAFLKDVPVGSPFNNLNANNGDGAVQTITYDVDTNRSTLFMDIVTASIPTGWVIFRRTATIISGSSGSHYWNLNGTGSPVALDTGIGSPCCFNAVTALNASTFGVESLRDNRAGTAWDSVSTGYLSIPAPLVYNQDFTIEYLVQPLTIHAIAVAGGTSRIVPGLTTSTNVGGTEGTWELRFDNYGSPVSGADLTAQFSLHDPGNNTNSVTDHISGLQAEIRGTTSFSAIGSPAPIYHLLGTVNYSAGQMDLYVNGVLEDSLTGLNGSPSVFENWITNNGIAPIGAGSSLADDNRSNRTFLGPGAVIIGGAWRATQRSVIDEIIIHEGTYMDAAQALAQSLNRKQ